MADITKVSKAVKHKKNPFIGDSYLKIDRGNKSVIVGGTKQVLVNTENGETEGIALLHKYKQVDKTQFVKLFVNEVQALFDLTKTGLKVFGYVLQSMKINGDDIYIHIPELQEFCGYKTTKQVYKGLAELIANQIIAKSEKANIWYINPNVVFNGDRIAFIKEYRMKEKAAVGEQLKLTLKESKE